MLKIEPDTIDTKKNEYSDYDFWVATKTGMATLTL